MRGLLRASRVPAALVSNEGVTAIEYGLIAGLIAVAIIAAITLLGGNLSSTFNTIAGDLTNAL